MALSKEAKRERERQKDHLPVSSLVCIDLQRKVGLLNFLGVSRCLTCTAKNLFDQEEERTLLPPLPEYTYGDLEYKPRKDGGLLRERKKDGNRSLFGVCLSRIGLR